MKEIKEMKKIFENVKYNAQSKMLNFEFNILDFEKNEIREVKLVAREPAANEVVKLRGFGQRMYLDPTLQEVADVDWELIADEFDPTGALKQNLIRFADLILTEETTLLEIDGVATDLEHLAESQKNQLIGSISVFFLLWRYPRYRYMLAETTDD